MDKLRLGQAVPLGNWQALWQNGQAPPA